MGKYQDIFQRKEMKYLLSETQCTSFLLRLRPEMVPDVYPSYSIRSLYFDTRDDLLVRTSLEKPFYKEKLRLRSYGVPGEEDTVFLELKKKLDGVVYKRRVSMTLLQAQQYLASGIRPACDGQILREIDWFLRFYHCRPKALLTYDRTAFSGKEDPTLRLTFDRRLRGVTSCSSLTDPRPGVSLLPEGQVLLELKANGGLPSWLVSALEAEALLPTSFSKYGFLYQQTDLLQFKGGIFCAS